MFLQIFESKLAGAIVLYRILLTYRHIFLKIMQPLEQVVLEYLSWNLSVSSVCTQLFKGKFFYCDGLDVRNITNKTQCLEAGHRWVRRKYNFDNLGQVGLTHADTGV